MEDQTLHHFMEDLLPLVVIPTMVIAGAWILSLIVAAFRQRAHLRAQTDFHNRMMEKFSSVEEFTAYLKSEAGKSFFENLSTEPSAPFNKILGSIQKGSILTLLGVGFFAVGAMGINPQIKDVLNVAAVASFMIGLGFLISSFISYRLAKTWGLIAVSKKTVSSETSPAV